MTRKILRRYDYVLLTHVLFTTYHIIMETRQIRQKEASNAELCYFSCFQTEKKLLKKKSRSGDLRTPWRSSDVNIYTRGHASHGKNAQQVKYQDSSIAK